MIFEWHFKERRRNKETKKQASPCNHKTESNNFSNVPLKTERSKKKWEKTKTNFKDLKYGDTGKQSDRHLIIDQIPTIIW